MISREAENTLPQCERTVTYQYMKPGEAAAVSNLVWRVFEEFEADDYSEEGIDEFKKYIDPAFLAARAASDTYFVLCCKSGSEIVGVIAIRDDCHISLLFVQKEDQRKGIARELVAMAQRTCCRVNPRLREITVNSSRYAVEIYEKLGFERTGPEQEKNGIRFTPMRLPIGL